jgi:transposase
MPWEYASSTRRKETYPTIVKSWVDTGLKNAVIEHGARLGIDVEVVNRNPEKRGFHVVKRRWVVERNIDWIMMHRRLARDYDAHGWLRGDDPHRLDRQPQQAHNGRDHARVCCRFG